MREPSCGQHERHAPERCITTAERDGAFDAMDCLHCGLALYGAQIAHVEQIKAHDRLAAPHAFVEEYLS